MAYYDFKPSTTTGSAYYLGTMTSGSTMNITSKYPDYANLTADNFVIEPTNKNTSGSYSAYCSNEGPQTNLSNGSLSASCSFSKSYNSSSGILTVTDTVSASTSGSLMSNSGIVNVPFSKNISAGMSVKVYLLPNIETI